MKKEKNKVFYLRGISFCNKGLKTLSKFKISIWWTLLPLLVVSFLLDVEVIASLEFKYLGGILASICVLCAWYSICLITYEICLIFYRKHCIKKVESYNMNITCGER